MSGDALDKLSDPKFLDSALGMMRGMDEGSLAAMMMSSGMCKTEAQAQQMAKQVCVGKRWTWGPCKRCVGEGRGGHRDGQMCKTELLCSIP